MRDPENISQALELEPDFIGFIFYNKSPRYVGQQWSGPGADFPSTTKKVGVFVNADIIQVKFLAYKYELDCLQLHGYESPDYCRNLFASGYEIIKVISPHNITDNQYLSAYKPWVHYFLFDTPTEQYGGSGHTFNWSMLEDYDNEKPVFLSGGISLNNINDVVTLNKLNLAVVDINSCFETRPGLKDISKLKEFKTKLEQL
jgi:phosphoribosylanthranilate isomerase